MIRRTAFRLAVTCAALALAPFLAAQDAATAEKPAPSPVASVEGITEYRLENGLRVLLFPDESKEKFTVNVTYLVGSRHEGRGETGMAHLLEHMVFKGTDTHPNIWGALQDHGATFNGTTWVDRTNYFETLPATEENLRFALSMEADRMVNSRISGEDLASEMTVVRNEFEMGENSPVGVLMERIVSAAFLWHNYGKSTIGNKSDIERVPVENLRAFYERYYQPDNAMLVVAGKFDPRTALGLIQETFGAIPRPERELDATYTEEPVQDGPRFVEVRRVASEQAAGAAYHVCAGSHPDAAALQVLGELLTSEPSGRLYRALVPSDLATGVFAFSFSTAEPGVLLALASSTVDQDVEACHETLLATLESVGGTEIGADEVERAKNKLLKDIRLSLNDSGRIGVELSEWAALGDWRMFFINRDRLKEVTPADVTRVAAHYLVSSNRTSGIFKPTDDPTRAEIPPTPDVSALVEGYEGTETIARGEAFEPTPENIESRTQRLDVAGIRAAFLPKASRGNQVVMSLSLHYGTEASVTGHETALEMLPEMLMRGTTARDYQALKDEIDRLQSRLSVFGGPGELNVSATTDREHLPALIALVGEILRTPTFPADQFQILKDERIGQIEAGLTDPQALAFTALARALAPFPPQSVHYVPTLEEALARTRAVTLEEVRKTYETLVGGEHVEVGLVGDFDPEAAERALTAALGGWESPAPYERIERPHVPLEAGARTIDTPDKRMAVVIVATSLPMKDDAPDYAALDFANYVLGASAKSRILTKLRHEGGLSYGAGSRLRVSSQDEQASLSGFAICAPENAPEAHRAMRGEIDSWIERGLTSEELSEGKLGYVKSFDNQLTSDSYVAGELRGGLEIGRTFDYHRRLIESVEGLTLEAVSAALQKRLGEASFVEIEAGDLEGPAD